MIFLAIALGFLAFAVPVAWLAWRACIVDDVTVVTISGVLYDEVKAGRIAANLHFRKVGRVVLLQDDPGGQQ